MLFEVAADLYCTKLNDKTQVGLIGTWAKLKPDVYSDKFEELEWFTELSDYQQKLVRKLKRA